MHYTKNEEFKWPNKMQWTFLVVKRFNRHCTVRVTLVMVSYTFAKPYIDVP